MERYKNSKILFERAQKMIPGGVNSPVRAFNAVGGTPIFMKSALGAWLYDHDGNAYIDLINSWGPMILGHANPIIEDAIVEALKDSVSYGAPTEKEIVMAELITSMFTSIEKVRLVSSGTEATMAAIRVARGFTQKNKIIKFEGCYHGHGDSFLIAAGSGALTMGTPDSAGITQGVAQDTLTATYNDLDSVEKLIQANPKQIACMIVEPVVGNMGCVLPESGFLEGLRSLCDLHEIVLIFDEVMTGFRLSSGGAQKRLNIKPDLTTLGKIIGGGLPVGAYGGKAEIMNCVSPVGKVYQAGTLSGNPITVSAGIAMLSYLKKNQDVYDQIDSTTTQLCQNLQNIINRLGIPCSINQMGSMYSLFFTDKKVKNFTDAKTSDLNKFSIYFHEMLLNDVYLAPAQFESLFISTAIDTDLVEKITEASEISLKKAFGIS